MQKRKSLSLSFYFLPFFLFLSFFLPSTHSLFPPPTVETTTITPEITMKLFQYKIYSAKTRTWQKKGTWKARWACR
uniref:Putative secreted protein n=1 Tax=Anopheles darlingi TaxID=43151 RepID=A0A2M4D7K2_ANODA